MYALGVTGDDDRKLIRRGKATPEKMTASIPGLSAPYAVAVKGLSIPGLVWLPCVVASVFKNDKSAKMSLFEYFYEWIRIVHLA